MLGMFWGYGGVAIDARGPWGWEDCSKGPSPLGLSSSLVGGGAPVLPRVGAEHQLILLAFPYVPQQHCLQWFLTVSPCWEELTECPARAQQVTAIRFLWP